MEKMDKPLTKNIRPDRAFATLADYESTGGYQGLHRAHCRLAAESRAAMGQGCRVAGSGWRGI